MKPRLELLALVLAACSGGSSGKKIDAALSDGQPLTFTGEYVDWFSTDTGFFCGIFQATFTVHGDSTRTNQTNPNGRFTLELAPAQTTQIDITPPTAQSECSNPKSTYNVPGIMIADASVIASGQMISARSFTVAAEPGVGFDSTKAQVLVHVDGTPRAVSITGTHQPTEAFDGTSWAAGDSGPNVYFPNVDPTGGTTTISTTGTALGTGSVPIAAGTFTYVTIVEQ
jgi:hypothetical protein